MSLAEKTLADRKAGRTIELEALCLARLLVILSEWCGPPGEAAGQDDEKQVWCPGNS